MQNTTSGLESKLVKAIGRENVLSRMEEKIPYKYDASYIGGQLPVLVCMPKNTEDISKILRICSENKVPVTARSGGTSLTGSSVSGEPGVIINTMNMNRILEINISSRFAVCEPGVRLDDLNRELGAKAFFYPPDPASSRAATVGGSISTNAGGLRAVRYGATKEWVLGTEFVIADGTVISTGEYTLKRSAGYDLTALIVGSEGTLGIVSKAILKIEPLPVETAKLIAFFDSIKTVGTAMDNIKSSGITPLMAEFMDLPTINSIQAAMDIEIPKYTKFMLMVDVDSDHDSIEKKAEKTYDILSKFSKDVITIKDPIKMDKIYTARKGAYASLLEQRENPDQLIVIGDVIVPSSELPGALAEIQEHILHDGLKATLFGHIGDGNIHANIFMNNNVDGRNKMEKLQMHIAEVAIAHHGCVSAEHGIGTEKNKLLYEEYRKKDSLYTLEIMKKIKKAFDPENIMNRGKIFYETD
ncbi:MAG: FAD-binding oxidoreductase [Ferroplasma sp.]